MTCCFALCSERATMRIRTKTGWANVCERNDLELANRDAREWLGANGLMRQPDESMRDWITRTVAFAKGKSTAPAGAVADLIRLPAHAPPELVEQAFADWSEAPVTEDQLEA